MRGKRAIANELTENDEEGQSTTVNTSKGEKATKDREEDDDISSYFVGNKMDDSSFDSLDEHDV